MHVWKSNLRVHFVSKFHLRSSRSQLPLYLLVEMVLRSVNEALITTLSSVEYILVEDQIYYLLQLQETHKEYCGTILSLSGV
jgi:hypothetical protein